MRTARQQLEYHHKELVQRREWLQSVQAQCTQKIQEAQALLATLERERLSLGGGIQALDWAAQRLQERLAILTGAPHDPTTHAPDGAAEQQCLAFSQQP